MSYDNEMAAECRIDGVWTHLFVLHLGPGRAFRPAFEALSVRQNRSDIAGWAPFTRYVFEESGQEHGWLMTHESLCRAIARQCREEPQHYGSQPLPLTDPATAVMEWMWRHNTERNLYAHEVLARWPLPSARGLGHELRLCWWDE